MPWISDSDAEEVANHIHTLYREIAEVKRRLFGMVRHGAVTDVDASKQMCRIQLGDAEKEPMKSDWVPYGLGFAGEFSQIWHPSVGQNMTLVSPAGNPGQSVAWPFTYCKQYPTPSADAQTHILCNFGDSRIEVWKDQIVIISDNIHLTALKGDITETADRHIEMETKNLKQDTNAVRNSDDDSKKTGSIISVKTGNPEKDNNDSAFTVKTGDPQKQGDSFISMQTGNPVKGDSKITQFTGSPVIGNSVILLQTSLPQTPLGYSLISITSAGDIIETAVGNHSETSAANSRLAGQTIFDTAGLEIDLSAPEVALLGHVDLAAKGGPAVCRVGDKDNDDEMSGPDVMVTGSMRVNAA